jgi:hypothetical protein
MSRPARAVAALTLTLGVLLLCSAGPSYAGDFQQCLDQAVNHNGEPPTCTKENGVWVASWPDDGGLGSGSGIPGVFVFLVVVAMIAGVGLTIWKVSTARTLARQAGMDPGMATRMTLLTDDGLDATYLASSLRPQQREQPPPGPVPSASSAPPSTPPSASARLQELQSLLDQGLVTQAEYDRRRQAVIDSV